MIDWRDERVEPAPKDRIIMVTNGWTWRPGSVARPAPRGKPAESTRSFEAKGSIALIHWTTDTLDHLKRLDGGAWVDVGSGLLFMNAFRWWAEPNNPLTPAMLAGPAVGDLVQNAVPDPGATTGC